MQQVIDKALGIHDDALRLRAYRSNLLAANIANTDTPRYKARDIDFRQILRRQLKPEGGAPVSSLQSTRTGHIDRSWPLLGTELFYRDVDQPSLDGNTVDSDREYTHFAQNALQYQASLHFLSARFRGLITAIQGE